MIPRDPFLGVPEVVGASETLPLLPLRTVLLPGAVLDLRIFERRYLDMIRECGRNGHGFGICLILDDDEAGSQVLPSVFGTEARIEDFDTGSDGLLTLRVRGHRRFQVKRSRLRDSGLVLGDLVWREPELEDELQPQHALLATILQGILEQVGGEHAQAPSARFDDPVWVGWRLAEFLPISERQRLGLLQEDDPHRRLDQLLSLID